MVVMHPGLEDLQLLVSCPQTCNPGRADKADRLIVPPKISTTSAGDGPIIRNISKFVVFDHGISDTTDDKRVLVATDQHVPRYPSASDRREAVYPNKSLPIGQRKTSNRVAGHTDIRAARSLKIQPNTISQKLCPRVSKAMIIRNLSE